MFWLSGVLGFSEIIRRCDYTNESMPLDGKQLEISFPNFARSLRNFDLKNQKQNFQGLLPRYTYVRARTKSPQAFMEAIERFLKRRALNAKMTIINK